MRDTNPVQEKKLLNSKWTAVKAINKKKHFIITEVEKDEEENVVSCTLEAVINKQQWEINWRELRDKNKWKTGWQ